MSKKKHRRIVIFISQYKKLEPDRKRKVTSFLSSAWQEDSPYNQALGLAQR